MANEEETPEALQAAAARLRRLRSVSALDRLESYAAEQAVKLARACASLQQDQPPRLKRPRLESSRPADLCSSSTTADSRSDVDEEDDEEHQEEEPSAISASSDSSSPCCSLDDCPFTDRRDQRALLAAATDPASVCDAHRPTALREYFKALQAVSLRRLFLAYRRQHALREVISAWQQAPAESSPPPGGESTTAVEDDSSRRSSLVSASTRSRRRGKDAAAVPPKQQHRQSSSATGKTMPPPIVNNKSVAPAVLPPPLVSYTALSDRFPLIPQQVLSASSPSLKKTVR